MYYLFFFLNLTYTLNQMSSAIIILHLHRPRSHTSRPFISSHHFLFYQSSLLRLHLPNLHFTFISITIIIDFKTSLLIMCLIHFSLFSYTSPYLFIFYSILSSHSTHPSQNFHLHCSHTPQLIIKLFVHCQTHRFI